MEVLKQNIFFVINCARYHFGVFCFGRTDSVEFDGQVKANNGTRAIGEIVNVRF